MSLVALESIVTMIGGGGLVHLAWTLQKAFETKKVSELEHAKLEAQEDKEEREHTGQILTQASEMLREERGEKRELSQKVIEGYQKEIEALKGRVTALETALNLQAQLIERQKQQIENLVRAALGGHDAT